MTDEKNWNAFGRVLRGPDPARVREFAATARKLQRERETSTELIDRLLRETPVDEWPRLASDESLRTSGALERIGKEVSVRLEKNPREALTLATVATEVADNLPADAYPPVVVAQVRAHAWKDRGQALCYLAKYEDALEALSRAEALLDAFGTLAHDRAVVRFVRATTLQQVNRFDESRELLNECKSVFSDHGDARLSLFCGISEGTLLFRLGHLDAAQLLFTQLLSDARVSGDRECEARIHNNLAHCAVQLSNFSAANEHLTRASALFKDLGWNTEALRADHAAARAAVKKGDLSRGIMQLYAVRQGFKEQGLVEEAGICGLDAVEALLSRDNAAEAARLADHIVQEFADAALNTRAVMAVSYLHEAIEAKRASAATARQVRGYIKKLRDQPELEFVAAG